MNLVEVIRTIVVQTVRAEKPCERLFGVVTSLEPMKIQVNEKFVLTETFLVLTQTIRNYMEWEYLKVGSKVIMTRQPGGKVYIVDDILETEDKLLENTKLKDWKLNHTHNCPRDGGTSSKGRE